MSDNAANYTMTEEQFKTLLHTVQKNNTVGNIADAQVPHGFNYPGTQTGLFFNPGAMPDMFSTVLRPNTLLHRLFNAGVTNYQVAEYDIITGRTAARGTNPTDYCGTPVKGGYAKLCTTKNYFGKVYFGTDTNVINQMGGRVNFADIERNIRNNPGMYPLVPDILKTGNNPNLTVWLQLYTAVLQWEESMEKVLHEGNRSVAPGSTEPMFIQEFDGLDQLIKTGYVDAETGVTCPSVDSIIVDWQNTAIDGTKTIAGEAYTIVQIISNIHYRLGRIAELAGLNPWRYYLEMHPDMFDALTAIWPCSYYTDGCIVNNSGTDRNNLDAVATINERDAMRSGSYLMVRGQRVEVVQSSAVALTNAGNGLSGPIRFIPDVVMGGYRPTYIEFFDQGNPDAMAWNNIVASDKYRVMNGGIWAATYRLNGFCSEYLFAAQPRLIMRTPYLAARLENVQFQLPGYSRDPFVTGGSYVNGGRTFGSTQH